MSRTYPGGRRHRWTNMGDQRRYADERGAKMDRCAHCGLWRAYPWDLGRTVYGIGPYQPGWWVRRPQCPDVERYMRAVAPELFSQRA